MKSSKRRKFWFYMVFLAIIFVTYLAIFWGSFNLSSAEENQKKIEREYTFSIPISFKETTTIMKSVGMGKESPPLFPETHSVPKSSWSSTFIFVFLQLVLIPCCAILNWKREKNWWLMTIILYVTLILVAAVSFHAAEIGIGASLTASTGAMIFAFIFGLFSSGVLEAILNTILFCFTSLVGTMALDTKITYNLRAFETSYVLYLIVVCTCSYLFVLLSPKAWDRFRQFRERQQKKKRLILENK